jgi:DNA-binding IclR family transcriptional regulator
MRRRQQTRSDYAVPAANRMLDIIEFLSTQSRPFGINELSRELHIPLNSVFRILKCLEARGYAEAERQSGGYRLGARLFTLGVRLHSRFELRRRARPHLDWLCEETGETCQIHTPHGDRVLVLDVVAPDAPYFMQIVPGNRLYYHPNAFGKAILAFLSEEEVRRRLPDPLPRLTRRTLIARDALDRELAHARETGLTYDREEYVDGLYCIGAPVFDVNGVVVAGVGVTGLTSRFHPENRLAFEKAVMACAERISRDTGYDGDQFERFRQSARALDATAMDAAPRNDRRPAGAPVAGKRP